MIGAAYTMTTKRRSLVRANKSATQRERNVHVCRFEAAAWRRGVLRDSGLSGCEGDYAYDGSAHSKSGSQNRIVFPKRHSNTR